MNTETQTLSKTDFLIYLDEPSHLWAKVNGVLETTIPSEGDRFLMDQGQQVEGLARDYLFNKLREDNTAIAIDSQRTFINGRLQTRVDVVSRDPEDQSLSIYEIKSSTSVKKEYLVDLAFQLETIKATEQVSSLFLVHLNKEYRLEKTLDESALFVIQDVTSEVLALSSEVKEQIHNALQLIDQTEPTSIPKCVKPKSCPCPAICHPDEVEYPIFDLPNLHRNKALELRESEIIKIEDIPEDYRLTERQQLRRSAVVSKQPVVEMNEICNRLSSLKFPLRFLDYETLPLAVPIFEGYSPHQHAVFQYSLHIMDHDGGEARHFEKLITEDGDPAMLLLPSLIEHLSGSGSVIVWNKRFEIGRNIEMGELHPSYAEGLGQINNQVFDLMEIFSQGLYVDSDFHGSSSLKYVLPVIVPEFREAYTSLQISDGTDAMLAWRLLMQKAIAVRKQDKLAANLLRYCRLDTLAMVEIYKRLKSLC